MVIYLLGYNLESHIQSLEYSEAVDCICNSLYKYFHSVASSHWKYFGDLGYFAPQFNQSENLSMFRIHPLHQCGQLSVSTYGSGLLLDMYNHQYEEKRFYTNT